ncbi:MAG TPA: HRDC domain-containing protein, partial [Gemmatimonadales bacterium]|nr:HRDC domain-containing protein [Gemmatimonadales bacterium]
EPLHPAARRRLARLRRALAPVRGPWGGCLLDAPTLRRLAERPPADAGTLAEVEGVGPVVAERWGGRILRALGTHVGPDRAASVCGAAQPWEPSQLLRRLRQWRADTARRLAAPPYAVLSERTLQCLAETRPADRAALSRIPGLGPRALAKWGTELLRLLGEPEAPAALR